ncbi:hypothetical protein A2334_00270 [Candidatus Roizmanbacteria bacterium RIFOXYB2_FULL_38_10]|uniref:DUF4230 domain-containing protein n=1 Tax=Candidatus Roizmanbacteria bacterium RIFOXYD1_FULL_38_12 TaxID=1802093 RepID=A0A1F7L276_9BACT|nr:MAG: hypothetical protein A3K47_05815 [Candidatus Roizmanbacteria bacterium RIFOXYA2_FULL_38_14]OGK64259.1 MAG: hypothetical protein A3K27_05815 [Candidatus Roizmanbacteria bacterium RIFOXYA1_FULL_37_12]OGK66105.1 MAG: hypothetical protein A3K38_05815 [Candidatus Roizmanbacteria bacterium RIFOXYB1_FULL_40_23]OGK67670.1 MAG: hypothetical protein A2334_00270 [Candidatus Roizmanbacteria bacterium RIFOXYB2_FULL_38_10]OGK70510.1 MAG: hypothetical protein A3K21_05820 [Candidatus Roizmanbacteria ba
MDIKKISLFLISVSLFFIVLLTGWFLVFKNPTDTNINTSRTAVIKEIRNLQRIETASFTIEKIIDGGTSGNVFQQLLFGDKILLIAHGQVIAGFDLSQISEKDIVVKDKNIRITLPKPQVLITTLDNTQTRVYDRTRGILNPGDNNLESKVREAAQNSIKEAACKGDILKQASDNARKQLTAFLSTLGFTQISIDIPESSC